MHRPVILNDVDALGVGVGPTQRLIKDHQEADGDCAGPTMENAPGQRVQGPHDPGYGIGFRTAHGAGLLRRPGGRIRRGHGRLPFDGDFVQVDGDHPPGLGRRYRRGDIGHLGVVVRVRTTDRGPRPFPDDARAPQNRMDPRQRQAPQPRTRLTETRQGPARLLDPANARVTLAKGLSLGVGRRWG